MILVAKSSSSSCTLLICHIMFSRARVLAATCSCSDPTDTCIMEARIGNPPPTTWSSCSVETLQTTLGGVLGMCLYNSPVSTVSDPSCGNGILEQGEQCDCGSDEVSPFPPPVFDLSSVYCQQ